MSNTDQNHSVLDVDHQRLLHVKSFAKMDQPGHGEQRHQHHQQHKLQQQQQQQHDHHPQCESPSPKMKRKIGNEVKYVNIKNTQGSSTNDVTALGGEGIISRVL